MNSPKVASASWSPATQLAEVDAPSPAQVGLNHVDLRLLGAFAAYVADNWQVQGTVYHVDARLHYASSIINDNFGVGYIQAERRFAHDLTGFVRWEDSIAAGDSEYLKLFEEFARIRYVGGVRWDFADAPGAHPAAGQLAHPGRQIR